MGFRARREVHGRKEETRSLERDQPSNKPIHHPTPNPLSKQTKESCVYRTKSCAYAVAVSSEEGKGCVMA